MNMAETLVSVKKTSSSAGRVEKIIKDKLYDTVIDEMLNKSVKITIETI